MNISHDVLINQIIPRLSLNEIRQLCQTNLSVRRVCQNDQLWHKLLIRDLPNAGSKPFILSPFAFYVQSFKSRQLIQQKNPDAPLKPNDLRYDDYFELLQMSRVVKVTKHKTRMIIEQVGNVYIIPDITTIRGLLEQIAEKAEIVGNYDVDFKIQQKDDSRGLIISNIFKYNGKYYSNACMNAYDGLLSYVNDPSLEISIAELHYPDEGYEMKEEFLDDIILNTIRM